MKPASQIAAQMLLERSDGITVPTNLEASTINPEPSTKRGEAQSRNALDTRPLFIEGVIRFGWAISGSSNRRAGGSDRVLTRE